MPDLPDHNLIERLALAQIEADGCPVRTHPRHEEIDIAIYLEWRTNDNVAALFGIGDGGALGGELIRQYRLTVTPEEIAISARRTRSPPGPHDRGAPGAPG